ncbi:MAG: hypothetical protein HXS41_10560 [Theionarchaea archaeon]|nr:hypothetical protein [Theionarchaea archaeon]MBU7000730.1 hypothetical protein [Theionarchaea archaeon]MBU7021487.1 hypothetical protein [Theionarchaea archaeon]MBU7033572.1 hypothetical protein [Theionarchaea archaeon]MBU7039618.1 hypothetical protein [Theionarchaea archaeon]
MNMIEREVGYFPDYGAQNTDDVLRIVRNRVTERDLKTVVVASTSGETGAAFSEKLRDAATVVVVSYEKMNPSYKQHIVESGGIPLEKTHLPLHTEGMDPIRETFRTFGQGLKVAVEVILIASDKGEVPLYEDVVGVGGTARGEDTAVVARATTTKDAFCSDETKRLEIREILAMSLQKKWW